MTLSPLQKRLCAILAGLMLTGSFPPGKLEWMVWFALVPLLMALSKEPPARAFRLGLTAGMAHFLTLVYWIVVVLEHYGGLNVFISLTLLLLLSLYLSLFPACFAFVLSFPKETRFSPLRAACLWVGLEYVRANALSGFPWCLLGHTQYENPFLIQIADLVGVYGISFLILLSNGVLSTLFLAGRISLKKLPSRYDCLLLVILVFMSLLYGGYRISEADDPAGVKDTIRVAVVQGNIDQSVKWDPGYQAKTITTYHALSLLAMEQRAQLIVWPETAVPLFFQDESPLTMKVREAARATRADLVFGSPAYERKEGAWRFYNRAYHLTRDGRTAGHYDKVHLVPFGEYVPLKRFLPFVRRLVPSAGDFAQGEDPRPMEILGHPAGVLICFEVIFPELVRSLTNKGARIILNLTNDAWFGMTSAPYQHLGMTVFRAVESGRPLIRAANTGFSAFIDSRGRIKARGEIFTEEMLLLNVDVPSGPPTFYARHGDLFSLSLLVFSLIHFSFVLSYGTLKRRKRGVP